MPQPYAISPSFGSDPVDEWIRLGVECHCANKFPDADRHYRQALRLDPRHAIATQNLAVLLAQQNQLNEALLTIERAALFDGDTALIHTNRAFMCLEADRLDEALVAAKYAMEISKPDPTPMDQQGYMASRLALAMISATAGHPDKALPVYEQMIERDPKHMVALMNNCFVQSLTFLGPEDLAKARAKWVAANRFEGKREPYDNNRSTTRPLRVGYVSGDFKRHSAAMIFGAVLLNHDKSVIEPYFYSTLPLDPIADDMTKRFKEAAGGIPVAGQMPGPDRWRDITGLNDEEADRQIRRDKIDILVDLAAHTNGGRLGIFVRKPAPVQVTAWGFAHGTGLPEIDYFFADPVVLPEAERKHYVEKVIDLPCIVTYLPPLEYNLKGTSVAPYFKNDFFVYGSYSRFEKLSDQCLAAFREILLRVPDSKMEFKDNAFRRPYSIKRVLAAMSDIDPKRLLFSINSNHPDHLLAHQQCDLCLDPWPHGGGVVSLEQLWMGCPLLTLYGTQPAGRTAASVLTTLGRTDWIAKDQTEYIEKAVALAGDVQTLSKARKTLRDEFMRSPVVAGYREAVEQKYREIWKAWVEK